MSSDYEKGYHGWAGGGGWDYEQGRRDREAGMPPRQEPGPNDGPDMSGVQEAGRLFGASWRRDPNRAIKETLVQLLGATVVGGVIGFAVGTWLDDPGLWLVYAKLFFWIDGMYITALLLGVSIAGAATRRGTLTLLFLGGTIAYMAWTYVLYPVFFIHIR